MPHEDPAEFAEFADRMRADLRPRGPLQELLAGRAVALAWKLLRVPAAEAEYWARRVAPPKYDEGAQELIRRFNLKMPTPPPPTDGKLALEAVQLWNDKESDLVRLQALEQRIERSLMATLRQLVRLQEVQGKADEEEMLADGAAATPAPATPGQSAAERSAAPDPGPVPPVPPSAAPEEGSPTAQNEPTTPGPAPVAPAPEPVRNEAPEPNEPSAPAEPAARNEPAVQNEPTAPPRMPAWRYPNNGTFRGPEHMERAVVPAGAGPPRPPSRPSPRR
jgi:hypothetical protein